MRLAPLVCLLVPSLALADRVAPTAGAPAQPMPIPPQGEVAPHVMRPMPPRPVPAVHASAEVERQGKAMAGTYACKGNRTQPDGSSSPFVSKITIKNDLDNAWIASQWTESAVKMTDYRTFDDTSKQWTRFLLASDGSHETLTSLGDKSGEWLWEGTQSSSTGTLQFKHHEKLGGKQIDLWGEALLGGTWQKVYTASCKR
jgi:hypothetical protein